MSRGIDEDPNLKEIWARGSGDTKVVVIPIRGFIGIDEGSSTFPGMTGTAGMALSAIRKATFDDDVQAIILDIDSGGGGITASDIIYQALQDFKASSPDRVVVALFGDVAASGAYYIALGADHIVARPTTLTGSIGVIMQTINAHELAEKIGISDITIKSGPDKDMLNPFRDPATPDRAAQMELLQDVIDQLHTRFVSLVATNRNLSEERVREIATGKVFLAAPAAEMGLIDQVGYFDDAVEKTADLLGVTEIRVFRYEPHFSLSAFFLASSPLPDVQQTLRNLRKTQLMYLWQP